MGIISLVVFGAVVGWLAGFFINKDGGIIKNIVVGIIGSFVGGFIFQLLGGSGISGFNLYSIGVGIIGSIIFISILRFIK